ncbi:unnamed protein product [Owenia fusiformis]|uniref:Target of EGR1 protein 1 n=1 Tax=Owenia fusiformis TaxID=6347 RepID=A0A8S4N2N2_OWEFU|nr:unnamed protein product [Owenia fusiformis]
MTSQFQHVPIIEVDKDNFTEMWPQILLAMKTSTFISIDAELSGLGERKKLNSKDVEERYSLMSEVARTRSILSIGLSCFKIQPPRSPESEKSENMDKSLTFLVQTFNLVLLCCQDYIVEPMSLEFLVNHGFDFNKQYAKGIHYYRGNDKKDAKKDQKMMRQLFSELLIAQVPIVCHNGLVDLVYLRQNLYAELPGKLSTFISDLSEMFSAGVYDTKYIVEFESRMQATYLEYVFKKSQRDNNVNATTGKRFVKLDFIKYPDSFLNVVLTQCVPEEVQASIDAMQVCENYANFGWCSLGSTCPKSHNLDDILDHENSVLDKKAEKKKNRRKRKRKQSNNTETEDIENEESSMSRPETNVLNKELDMTTNGLASAVIGTPAESGVKIHSSETKSVDDAPDRNSTGTVITSATSHLTRGQNGGHRAGFDAFMTGFAMATFITKCGKYETKDISAKTIMADFKIESLVNRVFLCGKDFPLQIAKSNFSKTSKDHSEKWEKLCILAGQK